MLLFITKITCAPVADKPLLYVALMSNNSDGSWMKHKIELFIVCEDHCFDGKHNCYFIYTNEWLLIRENNGRWIIGLDYTILIYRMLK